MLCFFLSLSVLSSVTRTHTHTHTGRPISLHLYIPMSVLSAFCHHARFIGFHISTLWPLEEGFNYPVHVCMSENKLVGACIQSVLSLSYRLREIINSSLCVIDATHIFLTFLFTFLTTCVKCMSVSLTFMCLCPLTCVYLCGIVRRKNKVKIY